MEALSSSYSSVVLNTSHPCQHQMFFGVDEIGLLPVISPPPGSIQFVPINEFNLHLNASQDYIFYFADRRFLMLTFNPSILPQFYVKIKKNAGKGYLILEVGCQTFWTDFEGIPVCRTVEQILNFSAEYRNTILMEQTDIQRKTGCLLPCNYYQYKVLLSYILII